MAAYQFKSVLLAATAVEVGASATDTPVSVVFRPTCADALNGVIILTVSDVTDTTGLTATLEQSIDEATWTDVESSDITAAGQVRISWNVETAAQQAVLPLLPRLRVTVTTGADDAVTVDDVTFCTRG